MPAAGPSRSSVARSGVHAQLVRAVQHDQVMRLGRAAGAGGALSGRRACSAAASSSSRAPDAHFVVADADQARRAHPGCRACGSQRSQSQSLGCVRAGQHGDRHLMRAVQHGGGQQHGPGQRAAVRRLIR